MNVMFVISMKCFISREISRVVAGQQHMIVVCVFYLGYMLLCLFYHTSYICNVLLCCLSFLVILIAFLLYRCFVPLIASSVCMLSVLNIVCVEE